MPTKLSLDQQNIMLFIANICLEKTSLNNFEAYKAIFLLVQAQKSVIREGFINFTNS